MFDLLRNTTLGPGFSPVAEVPAWQVKVVVQTNEQTITTKILNIISEVIHSEKLERLSGKYF